MLLTYKRITSPYNSDSLIWLDYIARENWTKNVSGFCVFLIFYLYFLGTRSFVCCSIYSQSAESSSYWRSARRFYNTGPVPASTHKQIGLTLPPHVPNNPIRICTDEARPAPGQRRLDCLPARSRSLSPVLFTNMYELAESASMHIYYRYVLV